MAPAKIIVIPCYNESSRLQEKSFLAYLDRFLLTNFIFVDDGSNDTTGEKLKNLQEAGNGRIRVISFNKNKGKAEAVRQGVLAALKEDPEYVGYWDADLATPLTEIENFSTLFQKNSEIGMVCGSRVKRLGSHIHRKALRHYPGRIIATLVSSILQLPVYDSQCGAKLFERSLAETLFSQQFIATWLFDVELFARVIQFYGRESAKNMIYELPLEEWRDIGKSTVTFSYLPKLPIELARIYFKYKR